MQDASFHLAADDGGQDFRAEGALSTSAPSAHTPGPWSVLTETRWPFGLSIKSAGGSVILEQHRMAYSSEQKTLTQVMHGDWMGKDQEEAARVNALQNANLRLIAAAPELLEALLLAESEIKHLSATVGLDRSTEKALTTCAAAIRKATGEQA